MGNNISCSYGLAHNYIVITTQFEIVNKASFQYKWRTTTEKLYQSSDSMRRILTCTEMSVLSKVCHF